MTSLKGDIQEMNMKLSNGCPAAKEYVELRQLAKMSQRDVEGVKVGLAHSNYIVTCRDQNMLVGMGRIIGDKATTFQIVDVVVHPDYQGKGLGKAIMQELMRYLEEHASDGAFVSLIADGDAKYLYEKFGFALCSPNSLGMYRFMKR